LLDRTIRPVGAESLIVTPAGFDNIPAGRQTLADKIP
jgi:hypothetical protein